MNTNSILKYERGLVMYRLPVGNENFSDFRDFNLNFVDKTLLIKELLDNPIPQILSITRPRRFGKTLNLSMLEHFFAATVNGRSTAGLFDGLKISQSGEAYMRHQGKYPVIFITLKGVKDGQYENAYAKLCGLVAWVYEQHQYLLSSDQLTNIQKEDYITVLRKTADKDAIQSALKKLSYYLFLHHGEKPWLLIDEYDTPLQAAYFHGYLTPMLELMRSFLGETLKTNPYINRAVLTGILKIAKENLFSDVSNVSAYSLLDSKYGQYFGFTEDEMTEILKQSGLAHQSEEIRNWYNGYQAGDIVVYNPWSIAKCLEFNGKLEAYWVHTGGHELIQRLLAQADKGVKDNFQKILDNQTFEATIDSNIVFKDLGKNPTSLYSLLLLSGYLKAIQCKSQDFKFHCVLMAPNREVLLLYRNVIISWFEDSMGEGGYESFLRSLVEGRIEEFTAQLQDYLFESMSFFDVKGNHPEKFYHGFVLGLVVSLQETHEVRSNRESGYGVYDVMLIPKDKNQLGLILEFKAVRKPKQALTEAAEEALQQVKDRGYAAELQQKGIRNILSLGLAFRGKQVEVLAESLSDHR